MEREIAGWIWPEHVRTTTEFLSGWINYPFDDTDWQAIEQALPETSSDTPEHWYDYPLAGTPPLTLRLARDPNADPVSIRVTGKITTTLDAKIDTLLSVLASVRCPTT